jgi:hypothetical protein
MPDTREAPPSAWPPTAPCGQAPAPVRQLSPHPRATADACARPQISDS